MKKTMRVVLEVDVEDLPLAERREHAKDMNCDVTELVTLKDCSAPEVAGVFRALGGDTARELFAGSDLYVLIMDCRPQSAGWIES